jgi:hypothetical protein
VGKKVETASKGVFISFHPRMDEGGILNEKGVLVNYTFKTWEKRWKLPQKVFSFLSTPENYKT